MNNISDMNPTFIFIDGSYYCFYRYYALLTWWKNAHPETNLEEPYENKDFVDKFKKTFVEKLLAIPKKLKIKKPNLILSKDCKRENIWRMELFPKYKGSRKIVKQIGLKQNGNFQRVVKIIKNVILIVLYVNLKKKLEYQKKI
jgi:5'-3' exonuclease